MNYLFLATGVSQFVSACLKFIPPCFLSLMTSLSAVRVCGEVASLRGAKNFPQRRLESIQRIPPFFLFLLRELAI